MYDVHKHKLRWLGIEMGLAILFGGIKGGAVWIVHTGI